MILWPERLSLSVAKLLDLMSSAVENHKRIVLLCYSAVFLSVCALLSATKLMWFDEMATYYPAKMSRISDLLAFFRNGTDVHTPTASLILRAVMFVFGDGPVTDRLPVMFGYLIMSVCIFLFVSRRCPAVYAAAAMLFPALTSVFYYATEIRAYGILLGFTGAALVCWQLAAEGRHRALAIPGLFLSLCGALCCHYYAILLCIPFGLAELVRTKNNRRVDAPVWAAIVLSPAILVLFLPAIHAARLNYGTQFWSRPSPGSILNTYRDFFTLTLAPILGSVIALAFLVPTLAKPSDDTSRPFLHERVLAGSLALLPVFAVPLSYLTGAYVDRYVLPAVAGFALFFAFSVCRALKADRRMGAAILLVFAVWFAFKNLSAIRIQASNNGGLSSPLATPFQDSTWMQSLQGSRLPVVATPAVFYMKLQKYAPEGVRDRVVYLVDRSLADKYEGISTGDTNLSLFGPPLHLSVPSFSDFVSSHPKFFLCAETTNPTWHIRALSDMGAQLRLVTRSETYFVFEVTINPPSAPSR